MEKENLENEIENTDIKSTFENEPWYQKLIQDTYKIIEEQRKDDRG